MEQLRNKADRFRKQGQLRDEELEATTSGESQEYWLLAIRAAREESRLLEEEVPTELKVLLDLE
jgi:hypothetical protein